MRAARRGARGNLSLGWRRAGIRDGEGGRGTVVAEDGRWGIACYSRGGTTTAVFIDFGKQLTSHTKAEGSGIPRATTRNFPQPLATSRYYVPACEVSRAVLPILYAEFRCRTVMIGRDRARLVIFDTNRTTRIIR